MIRMKTLICGIALAATALPATAAGQTTSSTARERARAQQERMREEQQRLREEQRERARELQRAAQDRNYPARQEERVSRTLKLGARGELTITNLSGDIVVTRRGGNDVQIEVVKTARGRTEADAREMLPLVQIDISERAGRGEARVSYPDHREPGRGRRNANVTVDFTVSAPENTRIMVKTLSGDVTVSDIKGELSLVTTSGNVSVSNAGRVTAARSTSGDVQVTSTTSENAIELTTVSGSVTARQVKAPRLQLETVSGKVIMQDVDAPRLDAQSITGDVEFTSRLAKNGRYDFNSHGGTVRIVVVGDTGFEFDANSFSGNVRSEITLKEEPGSSGSGRMGRRSLRGVFGDGSALLDVTTFSGSVILTRK
jgi:DUF4097 and DUF4098 domain-containing protein YvlB